MKLSLELIILPWINYIHIKIREQSNKSIRLSVKNYLLFHVCVLHSFSVFLDVSSFYFSFFRLHVCEFAIRSKVQCGSEPGASGLPYYCTPPVCVPAVLGGLAVWRYSIDWKYWWVWYPLLGRYSLLGGGVKGIFGAGLAARPCGTLRICLHSSLYWVWCPFKMIPFPAYCAR